jgi:hypothetical protein
MEGSGKGGLRTCLIVSILADMWLVDWSECLEVECVSVVAYGL